jgi:diaminopimelate epimerase
VTGDLDWWRWFDFIRKRLAYTDFKMVYYNSDGNRARCGNGGRCFRQKLQVIENKTTFIATDGLHHATIDENEIVALQMIDVPP